MWTLRDLMMWLSEDYKRKQLEAQARQMNNTPAQSGGVFINDSTGYNLEDLFRMHPQRQMLTDQWDQMAKPQHNQQQTQKSLYQYINSQPPKKVGMV
jgi:hypothetical protein